jgi:hypothetical protein
MTLVLLGVHGEVVALDRSTGQELWRTKLTGSDFVNLLLDQDYRHNQGRGVLPGRGDRTAAMAE